MPNGTNWVSDCGCVAFYPQLFQKTVLQLQADVGIALDGDGDRLIMVDSCGEVVDGDELLAGAFPVGGFPANDHGTHVILKRRRDNFRGRGA